MNRNAILCPLDFSEGSEAATRYASTLAARWGAELHFVHVYEPPYADVDGDFVTAARLESQLEPELRRLGAVMPTTDVDFRHCLLVGKPAEQLVQYVADHAIDLVVMGTHGRTGLRKVLMGSVAESVVRHAPCPVLSIKLPFSGQACVRGDEVCGDPGQSSGRIERILCPIDFSPTSDGALELASELARDYEAQLIIVHVEENSAAVRPSLFGLPPQAIETTHQLATYAPTESGVRFEHELLVGNVADSIVEFASRRHVDLIVMGSHGHTGVLRALVGSVAERVVRQATVPVLTLRPRSHADLEATLGVQDHE